MENDRSTEAEETKQKKKVRTTGRKIDGEKEGKKDGKKARKPGRTAFLAGLGLVGILAVTALVLYWKNVAGRAVRGITAEEVLASVTEKGAGITASEQDWTMNYEVNITADSSEVYSAMTLQADLLMLEENGQLHMNLTQTDTSAQDGEDKETTENSVESYAVLREDGWYNYSCSGDDVWYYSEAAEEDANVLGNEKELFQTLSTLDVEWSLADRTRRVNGAHTYVLTAQIPAETAMKLLALFDMDAVFGENGEGVSWLDGRTVTLTYAVYTDTMLPAELSLSCVSLYQEIWEAMQQEAGDDSAQLSVNQFDVSVIFTSYEVTEDISVPESVVASAEEYAGEWVEPAAKEWYDYFTENRGTDLEGKYGITADNYQDVPEEEWESIYYEEIGY